MGKKIILASGSPRRKELMAMAGLPFEIMVPEVDETPKKHESPKKMVKRLSREKALEIWRNQLTEKDSAIIISADTTVVSPRNQNLGKPRNEKEAMQMVSELQGRTHSVFTGYTIVDFVKGEARKIISRVIETKVTIQALSKSEVREYVEKGESLDKAGAYAAQGYGMAIIEKISGSYTNVVGLPMTQVKEDLKALGWKA